MSYEFFIDVMRTFEDERDDLFWRVGEDNSIDFYLMCSDVFMWGCSDAEALANSEDLKLYKQCQTEINDYKAVWLYCSRKRKMRPQGAFYKYFSEEQAKLFDACGPVRVIGFGNPYDNKPGELNDYNTKKT